MNIRSGLVMLTLVATAHAAELKPRTIRAWQEYVQTAIGSIQEQPRSENHFLQIDSDPNEATRLRSGEILVAPGYSQGVKKVPAGMIHDWLGTAFIAHATLPDVLSIVSDYDRYKEFYRPTVVDSRTLMRDGRGDRFSMVLMNQSLFMKTALDSEYSCSSVRVSDRRAYTVSQSTRIREIEDYRMPGQRELREGEGSGFIWRLLTITRLEERDGGVYVELEAVALSRDIPLSLRWIVEPIVRRISRNSLEASLRQTADAVHSSAALTASDSPVGTCTTKLTCARSGPNLTSSHSLR